MIELQPNAAKALSTVVLTALQEIAFLQTKKPALQFCKTGLSS
jgi:hypothetical protein